MFQGSGVIFWILGTGGNGEGGGGGDIGLQTGGRPEAVPTHQPNPGVGYTPAGGAPGPRGGVSREIPGVGYTPAGGAPGPFTRVTGG